MMGTATAAQGNSKGVSAVLTLVDLAGLEVLTDVAPPPGTASSLPSRCTETKYIHKSLQVSASRRDFFSHRLAAVTRPIPHPTPHGFRCPRAPPRCHCPLRAASLFWPSVVASGGGTRTHAAALPRSVGRRSPACSLTAHRLLPKARTRRSSRPSLPHILPSTRASPSSTPRVPSPSTLSSP